ncbi:MAG TPA: PepSY-associated TM helix domain-containing protein [Dyella sp.]|uniref:PepSY-associated TM helix domain-containing protein n=1 Tax=Dyella sp. TaxID=1869338 RepID=UPI002B7E69A0|nr:PepSY-associated TM helix domain-containing protein [Dyella sp.]HUB88091.1 PepSY-associated TM helix domain-containing protein [Dyella sp.]
MKAATLRTFQAVHTWTGLLAGFALFVAFYAGALTVFHDAIAAWQNPPWRSVADANVPLTALIDRLVAQHPQAKDDFGIVLPTDASHAAYAYWDGGDGARFATYSGMAAPSDEEPAGQLADFIYALHDSLGLPVLGLYLMGIVSLLYGLALISGVLIHLPRLASDLFALRAGPNLKRLWQDAHNAIGVLSLPFHIIFAVTGALLCLFTLTLAALNTIAFDGKLYQAYAQVINTAPVIAPSKLPAAMLPPDVLVERARQAAQAGKVTRFEPDYLHYLHYGDRNAVIEVRGLSQHTLGTYGTVALSAADGRVLSTHVGTTHSINGISNSAIYGLHFGSFGGAIVRWLYFMLGLGGAFLFYSGNLLWIESRRKRRHVDQPRRTRVMARATIGVCIGTCLGISGAFAATWISIQLGIDAALPQRVACYGLFAASCGYASVRPIPRSAVELLLATALLTAAVALADLIANAGMLARDLAPQSQSVLGVDVTGLAMSLVFAALARATMRRARHGDPHSVWALA